jgi:hypothetical protein
VNEKGIAYYNYDKKTTLLINLIDKEKEDRHN